MGASQGPLPPQRAPPGHHSLGSGHQDCLSNEAMKVTMVSMITKATRTPREMRLKEAQITKLKLTTEGEAPELVVAIHQLTLAMSSPLSDRDSSPIFLHGMKCVKGSSLKDPA
ncbi:hypothetical protein HGM15179_013006 [Zosterops borbonicus]|uniref:Uncharacterized protein n=1 Tax=Zosterops borbonicus TaxID=364589 RepID=A0A8K1G8U0_9PASS|nr:hypothetical protein HGM15179_013006 [Zosterops borbonicus]